MLIDKLNYKTKKNHSKCDSFCLNMKKSEREKMFASPNVRNKSEVLCLCFAFYYIKMIHVRRLSKKFVDFVNKIKRTDATSLKFLYVRSQFNTNKRGKFQTNHLINIIAMTICLMLDSATWSTPRC